MESSEHLPKVKRKVTQHPSVRATRWAVQPVGNPKLRPSPWVLLRADPSWALHKSGHVWTLRCVHAASVYFAARRCAVCMRIREAVSCRGLCSWISALSFLLRLCCEGRLNPCSLPSWSCLKFSKTFPLSGDILPGENIKPCFSRFCEGFGWVWPPTANSFPSLHAPPPPIFPFLSVISKQVLELWGSNNLRANEMWA